MNELLTDRVLTDQLLTNQPPAIRLLANPSPLPDADIEDLAYPPLRSTSDALVFGAFTSADLARDVLHVLAAVAAKHRIAVLVVHDSPRSGGADLVGRTIFGSAPIVFALEPRVSADPSP